MLNRLLREDFDMWNSLIASYEHQAISLKVPMENTPTTLKQFNYNVEELYSRALFDYNRSRRNRDAIQRFLKSVLDDAYRGSNAESRKAAGIQYARQYPAPDFWPTDYVNIFDLEDIFNGYYYMMEGVIKSLEAKAQAKITNNSLLNLERQLTT